MTISTETTVSGPYAGDDSTTEFAIGFIFWDNSDIRALKRVTATGVETALTLGTHYTLAGGDGSTGTLTTTGGNTIATGETLTIKSARSDTQPTSLPLGGEFPSTAVERALDQAVRLIQQRATELDRVLKFSETSPDSEVTFPDVTGNASKTIRVNGAGTGLEAVTPTDGGDLALPVSLGDGGTNADLSAPDALSIPRINAGGTAMELRTPTQARGDVSAQEDVITTRGDLVRGSSTGVAERVALGTAGQVVGSNGTDTGPIWRGLVQQVVTQTGAVATGTTTIPADDTIPQSSEGDQYMTRTITPKASTHRLVIEVVATFAASATGGMAMALFQDSGANAIAATVMTIASVNGPRVMSLHHEMAAGGTSEITFKVRAGNSNAGTTTFNGASGSRLYGGVLASSILIREYAA